MVSETHEGNRSANTLLLHSHSHTVTGLIRSKTGFSISFLRGEGKVKGLRSILLRVGAGSRYIALA